MAADKTPLRDLAPRANFHIGAMIHPRYLDEPEYARVVARHFDTTVAGNEMKFHTTQPRRGEFDFTQADRLAAFAARNGMRLRGHCLVWHHPGALPKWFAEKTWTRDEALEVLREHIHAVTGRFRGKCYAWDVVNEAIADDDKNTFYREESPWYQAIGPDYLDHAFRFAHEADPDALLFYNDYEIEWDNAKAQRCYELVRGMRRRSVPIHGMGFQAHTRMEKTPAPGKLADNLRRFGDLGLVTELTELDVWIRGQATPDLLARQARVYGQFTAEAVADPTCQAIVLWGFSDRYSWVPHFTKGEYGQALVFEEDYRPKPAFAAIAEALAT